MSEKKLTRDQMHGWGKIYVVYNKRLDILGIHKGPKFLEVNENCAPLFWPHDIDHGGMAAILCDENFREEYAYIGEL
jgi:hypothetical protein